MINGLDLFSGYGGLSIALRDWVRPIAYCEIDSYCQAILLSRMANGSISKAPIWNDIKTLQAMPPLPLFVDIIYGGFPCQDISISGHGKGLAGERSGLYWEIHRLAKEIKPSFIFLENVPRITSLGGESIVWSLAEIGYDCRWCVLSALGCGAPHKRERWWLLAYSAGSRISRNSTISNEEKRKDHKSETLSSSCFIKSCNCDTNASDAMHERCNEAREKRHSIQSIERNIQSYWQEIEPPVCGVDDGPAHRVDRIRALGNGVVPQCAKKAFKYLMGLNHATN